ncbi:zinc ABC transporter substrate-binding protein [Alphaproteobacteria bacterium]|nr:zinc ABC transporter substrate-binding protein [Alphaproteobacteria bacterium]
MAIVRKAVTGLMAIGLFCAFSIMPVKMVMADQKPLSIVASIKPVHALVAGVMGDLGTPHLLLAAPTSAHHFTLKPSQARALQNADIVFWIGPGMEQSLTKALATLAADAQSVALDDSAGLVLFDFDDDGHDDHGTKDKHDGHGGHGINPHIWLDPFNAQIMLGLIADHLGKADPVNAKAYQANADAMRQTFAQLQIDIARQLAPFAESEFLVLHDAHIYFERRFGMRAHAAITTEPDVMPTAAKIKKLRHDLESHPMDCIFGEPFLGQKAVRLIAEGSDIRIGQLDPLGSQLPAGASLYADLLKSYAAAFKGCLAP